MEYISTRGKVGGITAAQAIHTGISPDGGLFVPQQLPSIDTEFLQRLCALDYQGRATQVLRFFLSDYTQEELAACVAAAYGKQSFEGATPAPLVPFGEGDFILELWHGPTCAFKDMALQLLPRLLTLAVQKTGSTEETVILTATSGDTGKAALEGFRDVAGTRIMVFYPQDGVSPMQKHQMTTQQGDNLQVMGIKGNFDDAQTGVKTIFGDQSFARRLKAGGFLLSSANSINWGRLVPQIVYYISAYCDLVHQRQVAMGEMVNVCVPTGNFGNILAAYYAKQMGVPIGRLICASNRNNVLTDFIHTGQYNRNRPFHTTLSPSMDILISSNLERLLFDLCDGSGAEIAQMMDRLRVTGAFVLSEKTKQMLQQQFFGAFCDDQSTLAMIRQAFEIQGYLCDPHTAVALGALAQYREATGDTTKTVVVSTASPYKFAGGVLTALGTTHLPEDGFAQLERLSQLSGWEIPKPLLALRDAQERFGDCCAPANMPEAVLRFLGL